MWELIKYIYEQIQLQDKQLDGSFWSTSEHGRRDHSMPSPIPIGASLVAQTIKNLFVTQETGVRSLGQEDPLEKGMAGYPLWYSCLENSMGRQELCNHRVTKSWTQLSN